MAAAPLAGEIVGDPAQRALLARYARSRRFFDQARRACSGPDSRRRRPGNLLVARAAFEELGGFAEGIRSGGDLDFCRRLQPAGWALEHRPGAVVAPPPPREPGLLLGHDRALRGRGALAQRAPPGHRRPAGRCSRGSRDASPDVGSAAASAAAWSRRSSAAIDGLGLIAHNVGYRASNGRPPRRIAQPAAPRADRQPLAGLARIVSDNNRGQQRAPEPLTLVAEPSRRRGSHLRSRIAPRSRTWCAARRTRAGRPFGCAGRRGRGRWGTLWLTTLLIATNAPCAFIASRIADESRRAFANSGPTSSSGRSQIVSKCSRGTSSEWPGNSGRWSRKASETSSSKTTCAVLVAGDDRAEAAVWDRLGAAGSGNDRQGARARCRARARRGRRCSRRRPGRERARMRPSASRESDSIRASVTSVEVVDLAVPGGAQAVRRTPGGDRRHVALGGAAQHADREGAVVELGVLADPQRLAAEVGERVGVLGDRRHPLGRVPRRPRAASGPGCAGSAR